METIIIYDDEGVRMFDAVIENGEVVGIDLKLYQSSHHQKLSWSNFTKQVRKKLPN